MLTLGKKLTELLSIPGPPFQYLDANQTWRSVFDAASAGHR
jgi:hypothetical protein